ncbi:MAG: fused MFS/spermidine synthase [Roseiflexaceae bacterium]|nr:fused MFS/spermidine synthase [Roseiflexaceae bacterium]
MHSERPTSAASRDAVIRSSPFLLFVVFMAGIGTLGVEMVASRLLAPYFGTSQPIWAVVIGMTLIYLAVGYRLGGGLADRQPDERVLYQLICWAGLLTGFIPLLANPILRFSQQALSTVAVGSFLGALVGVLLLFAAPVILLAMVSPFAVRVQLKRVEAGVQGAGRTAGSLSSLSTVGSIVGTFLTVLVLIPAIGTARTTYLFAALLIIVGLVGLRDWRYGAMLAVLGMLALFTLNTQNTVKAAGCRGCTLIHEEESQGNYIQVAVRAGETFRGDATQRVNLILNEGQALHSIYNTRFAETGDPLDLLTGGGPWDYFAVAPYFYPNQSSATVDSLLMLGSATGTMPQQFLAIYGPTAQVDAVEIDGRIVANGRKYFGLEDASVSDRFPNYRVHVDDARYWLETKAGSYDIIGMDAYHQPYIPFHLTTVEFFRSAQAHLSAQGVVVVNAGVGPGGDDRLGNALATTMLQVFPQVFVIDTVTRGNQILVGVNTPVGDGPANFLANYAQMQNTTLQTVMGWALVEGAGPVREFRTEQARFTPFTDDRAPVEQLIDSLIFDAALE